MDTYKCDRVGPALQPERFEIDLVQGPQVNDRVIASSVVLLLICDEICQSVKTSDVM